MIFTLTVAAIAGSYTAPEPIRRDTWYGEGVLEGDAAWRFLVGSALTVRPDGSIQDCEILVSSGNPDVDDGTCAVLQRRARFVPAKAPDGTPMYGVFRGWTAWGGASGGTDYNFKIIVDSLPPKMRSPARVDIMFLVSGDGQPSFCTDQNGDDHPTLVQIACQRLGTDMVTPPVRTEANVPVASVQDATVSFVTASGR